MKHHPEGRPKSAGVRRSTGWDEPLIFDAGAALKHRLFHAMFLTMEQPGLDGRHRDANGRISVKHGNTLNMHLVPPIPGFGPLVTLHQMRLATGKFSESDVRRVARLNQIIKSKKVTPALLRNAVLRVKAKREAEQQNNVPALLAAIRRLIAKSERERTGGG